MRRKRRTWLALAAAVAIVVGAAVLYLLFFRPALALEFYYTDTDVLDFNAGTLDHTALSWRDDGEIQLLPVGLGQPWVPGNNTGLEPRSGHGAVYYQGYIYVIGGESNDEAANNEVFYTRVYTDVLTPTERLADWETTTPLPPNLYADGVVYLDAVALNDYVYVFGGKEDEGGSSTYYDTVAFAPIQEDGSLGFWDETAALDHPLMGMEAKVLHGRIYVIGGLYQSVSRRDVYYAQPGPDGHIAAWGTTEMLPDPVPGAGGYYGSAVTVEHNRLYVMGGASGLSGPSVSPYIYFTRPDTTTGEIVSWQLNSESLGGNLFASEGAAYQSGLLLTVAGAKNNITSPSGDVLAGLVDHPTGYTGEWVNTIGLEPERFWHAVVQDEQGWLYCIGGSTGSGSEPILNDISIAPPYSGGGGGGGGMRLEHSRATSETVYAPDGIFYSRQRDLLIAGEPVTVTSLAWNTTLTNTADMGLAMEYRYHVPEGAWTDWELAGHSPSGRQVTSSIALDTGCDGFQYRAFLTTTVMTQTPLLNAVRVGVLAPPNLVAEDVTVSGCSTCPKLVPPNEEVQIEFTVLNQSSGLKGGNNFWAMLFISDAEFTPEPPDCPPGCDCQNDPGGCPLIWGQQGDDYTEGYSTVLTTTWIFEDPGRYYLIAYIDYDDAITPTYPPPIYNVKEFNELDNWTVRVIDVGEKNLYLPLVINNWP
ncbi:MAG: hypothetical protein JXA37_10410 [Chloroflexia bacterium]|nr:hypothetical protein [Chloroflexia bacterium]